MSRDLIRHWAERIATTGISRSFQDHLWVVPTSQSLHLAALSLVFASALLISARLLVSAVQAGLSRRCSTHWCLDKGVTAAAPGDWGGADHRRACAPISNAGILGENWHDCRYCTVDGMVCSLEPTTRCRMRGHGESSRDAPFRFGLTGALDRHSHLWSHDCLHLAEPRMKGHARWP